MVADKRNGFHLACEYGHIEIVKFLFENDLGKKTFMLNLVIFMEKMVF